MANSKFEHCLTIKTNKQNTGKWIFLREMAAVLTSQFSGQKDEGKKNVFYTGNLINKKEAKKAIKINLWTQQHEEILPVYSTKCSLQK